MRIMCTLFFGLIFTVGLQAQNNPVKWKISTEKIELDQYKIVLHAHMDGGWMLYSQHTPEGGPIPTEISFTKTSGIEWIGETIEPVPIKEQDPFFEIEVWKFKKDVKFQQFFTKKEDKAVIHGHITFMTCDGERCLPPKTQDFTLHVD